MGKRGRKAKDQFSTLSSAFRDAVLQSSTDEIKKRISGIAILDCTERAMLKVDPDINQAKSTLKNLMEPIRENLKSYKLQIEFCKRTLDDKDGGAHTAKVEELAKAEKLAATKETVTISAGGKSATVSHDEFKNNVGDALEKALGKDKVHRDIAIKS